MGSNLALSFFNYLPIPFMFLGLAATSYVFNHNPLYYLIQKDEHDDAIHVISQIYVHTVEHEFSEIYKCLK